jgi:hypothetical protein
VLRRSETNSRHAVKGEVGECEEHEQNIEQEFCCNREQNISEDDIMVNEEFNSKEELENLQIVLSKLTMK